MFNWLFDKKKSVELPTTVETTIVNEEITEAVIPVYEETPKERPNIDTLFEAFPTLKHLCDMQFEMDQRNYKNSPYKATGLVAPKFSDVYYYKQLDNLPEISKVLSNNYHHHEGNLHSYLSINNEYVTIHKIDNFRCDTQLFISINKINPPVMRIVENFINNHSSWTLAVTVEKDEDNTRCMLFSEACMENLRLRGVSWMYDVPSNEVKKYAFKGGIRICFSEGILKVNSDQIKLSDGEVEILREISAEREYELIKESRLKFEQEETQKRAAMDEVVAELFKGE